MCIISLKVTLETDDTKPLFVVRCYHVSSFVCLMSLIYTVVSVTTVVVWGPQLALRGSSPTAMETAVQGVKAARYGIYISFVLGVITFLLMTVTVSWIQMDDDVARICSACAFLTFVLILKNGYSTKMTFRMMAHNATTVRLIHDHICEVSSLFFLFVVYFSHYYFKKYMLTFKILSLFFSFFLFSFFSIYYYYSFSKIIYASIY